VLTMIDASLLRVFVWHSRLFLRMGTMVRDGIGASTLVPSRFIHHAVIGG
jgi:hypothetical protein